VLKETPHKAQVTDLLVEVQDPAHVGLPVVHEGQANRYHDKHQHDQGGVVESNDAERREDNEESGEGVAAVVKEFSHGSVGVCATSLLAVDGVQRLVDEEAQGTGEVRPTWSLKKSSRGKTHM